MTRESDPSATIERTLRLLWRARVGEPEGKRGPKQRFTVDHVVETGIALADADGLAGFSVRKVAERLGIGPMTIYTYVPGREELIALMVDHASGETPLPPHSGTLRERLEAIARQVWVECHRHPWLLQADTARPWVGPHVAARYEWQLAALEGIGLGDLEMDHTVTTVTSIAQGAARSSVAMGSARATSGMSDGQWWEINAPILDDLMAGEDYPVSGRVGVVAGEEFQAPGNPEASLTFALDRFSAGLEAVVRARQ